MMGFSFISGRRSHSGLSFIRFCLIALCVMFPVQFSYSQCRERINFIEGEEIIHLLINCRIDESVTGLSVWDINGRFYTIHNLPGYYFLDGLLLMYRGFDNRVLNGFKYQCLVDFQPDECTKLRVGFDSNFNALEYPSPDTKLLYNLHTSGLSDDTGTLMFTLSADANYCSGTLELNEEICEINENVLVCSDGSTNSTVAVINHQIKTSLSAFMHSESDTEGLVGRYVNFNGTNDCGENTWWLAPHQNMTLQQEEAVEDEELCLTIPSEANIFILATPDWPHGRISCPLDQALLDRCGDHRDERVNDDGESILTPLVTSRINNQSELCLSNNGSFLDNSVVFFARNVQFQYTLLLMEHRILTSATETTTEESQTTTEESQITTEESQTTTEESQTTTEEGQTTTEESQITMEESQTTTEESQTTTEESQITMEESQTTTEESQITMEESQITTEESQITMEESQITTEESQITTEESQITTEESQITTEESQITTEERLNTDPPAITTSEGSKPNSGIHPQALPPLLGTAAIAAIAVNRFLQGHLTNP